MLDYVYNSSPYKAINAAYPDKFKPWELLNSTVSRNYWDEETAKDATRWMIEEKLQWTEDDIINNLTAQIFKDNGLSSMLQYIYNNSPYLAVDALYPGKFQFTDLKGY